MWGASQSPGGLLGSPGGQTRRARPAEQPHSRYTALPTPRANPFLSPLSDHGTAPATSSLLETHRGCKGTTDPRAPSAAGIPLCCWHEPQLRHPCQLVAKHEHGLKQLTKLLSRILAPRGSKPAGRSLEACQALGSHRGQSRKVCGVAGLCPGDAAISTGTVRAEAHPQLP